MTRRRIVVSVLLLLFVAGVVIVSAKLISRPKHQIRIIGNLTVREVKAIENAAHRRIFAAAKISKPPWVPGLVHRWLWMPVERVFSDGHHPIDIIHVRGDAMVQVWYRGPEMKAYVHGKEDGWFPQSVNVTKGTNGWN